MVGSGGLMRIMSTSEAGSKWQEETNLTGMYIPAQLSKAMKSSETMLKYGLLRYLVK